jgi:hypothetical protein
LSEKNIAGKWNNFAGHKIHVNQMQVIEKLMKAKNQRYKQNKQSKRRSTSEFSKPKKTNKEGVPQTIIYEFKSLRTQISKNSSTIIDNSTTKNQNLPSCIEILKVDHE